MSLQETDPRIIEAVVQLRDFINETLVGTRQTHLFAESHIYGDSWSYDSCVTIREHSSETGYTITPMIEQKPQGLDGKLKDTVIYYIQHEEVIRGTYRYANGDGEPDDIDVVDDFNSDSLHKTTTKLLTTLLENNINGYYESLEDEAMAKEEYYEEQMP